eukprot:1144125-Pelagomonas_calceolata.AAC.9
MHRLKRAVSPHHNAEIKGKKIGKEHIQRYRGVAHFCTPLRACVSTRKGKGCIAVPAYKGVKVPALGRVNMRNFIHFKVWTILAMLFAIANCVALMAQEHEWRCVCARARARVQVDVQ